MSEYPRMLYRAGHDPDHANCGVHLLMQGQHDVETLVVGDEAEHLAAAEEGWHDSPALAAPVADPAPRRQRKEITA